MNKLIRKIIGTMVIMAVLICLACPAAFASDSVNIYAGATLQDNLTTTELNDMTVYTNQEYSSHKHDGSFIPDYHATGADLLEALLTAIYNHDPYTTITDESSLLNAYSKIEFKENTSFTSGQLDLYDVLHGYKYDDIYGTNPVAVPAILATDVDPNPIRNFYGQQDPSDNTAMTWIKNLDTIVLSN